MAFSASWNYTESYTAASIIERALKRLGVMDAGETVPTAEQTDALVVLNLIVKEWSAKGADVWLRNTGHLFLPSPGTAARYTVGTSGTAKFTSAYYVTTLAVAANASATTITVTDDTNMANADVILVEQDDGTLLATTINGAPAANSVTLTAGLAAAAAVGNIVYSWPTANNIAAKITKIVNAARRITNTDNVATNAGYMEGIDSPLSVIGEEEYRLIPQKLQTGVPVSVHHRQKAVNPELYVWPTGGSGNVHSLVLEYNAHIQDLDGTTNNLEVPPEGVNALAWQLAAELAPEYGISEVEQRRVWSIANNKVTDFFDFQVEDASVMFGVDVR